MVRKIKNENAFSLSETLITVLLLTIVLSAVTTGIGAVINSYKKIVLKADGMTLLSTIAVSIDADLSSATGYNSVDKSFFSGARGYKMSYDNRDGQVCVIAKDRVIPIATSAAHTDKLTSEISGFELVNNCFSYTITVKSKADNKTVAEQNYVVRPYDLGIETDD